jgi:hypothetical protein
MGHSSWVFAASEDWDSTQFSIPVLLGVAVLILYTMFFTWAVALKEHMGTCTQRIFKAMETIPHASPEKPD